MRINNKIIVLCRQSKILLKKACFLSRTKKRDLDIYKCPKLGNRLATQNRKNVKKWF